MSSRVYDCFGFSNELDLLEFRLGYLWDVVDQFVLVESPRTFSGLDKPLAYGENKERFAQWNSKIRHVVVDDLPPPVPTRRVSEMAQRSAFARGLDDAEPDDVIMICDLDEVPDATVVARLPDEIGPSVTFEMRVACLRANWLAPRPWLSAGAVRFHALEEPNQLRHDHALATIKDAGAHLSYLFDIEGVSKKFASFAHDEYDKDRFRSLTFLAAMQQAAVLPITGWPLEVLREDQLDDVQRSLLQQFPAFFDFNLRPKWSQRLARDWWRARQSQRLRLSNRVVDRGDRALLAALRTSQTIERHIP